MLRRPLGIGAFVLLAACPALAERGGHGHGRSAEIVLELPSGADQATVSIDGQAPAAASAEPRRVSAGTHTLLVHQAGYKDFFLALTLTAGEVKRVPITLEPAGPVVQISSDPVAELSVDGTPTGRTPVELHLEPGHHALRLTHDGFSDKSADIQVSGEGKQSFHYALDPVAGTPVAAPVLTPKTREPDIALDQEEETPEPVYKRWYVWTGAGAVVAAAVVGGIVAANQSPRQPATPTQVCHGACDITVNAP